MMLPRLQNMKMQIFVMPAWIAGIQVRKDASGDTPRIFKGDTEFAEFSFY